MALKDAQYADVAEVRNVGRRRANIYLTNGWTLLGWEMEQRIARRDGPPDEAGVPQPMHIKLAEILYIVGRTEDVDFEGDDIHQYERDENRARREQETERAAKAVDEGSAVETTMGTCGRCRKSDRELRGGICGDCGQDLIDDAAAERAAP